MMAKARKIERPASLDAPYVPPEDASVAELNAMVEQVRGDATKLVDPDSRAEGTHEERVALANWYIAAIEAMQNRQTEIEASAQAEADALAEVRNRLGAPGQTDPDNPDGDPDPDPDADAGVHQQGDAADPAQVVPDAQGVLVASGAGSARRSPVAAAASAGLSQSAQQGLDGQQTPQAYLTAAAGIRGQEAGATVDFEAVGRLADTQFGTLPKRSGAPVSKLAIATVHSPTRDERLVAAAMGNDLCEADKAIEWAVSMERLRQQHSDMAFDQLVAAGWCSPSETLYDLIDMSTTDGLIDLPGITVTRGGVRFSLGPDFTTVYNAGQFFTQTEAQNIAGNTKPAVNIPCPSFTDHRMNVDGIYLTGDILSQKGYPEAYADFTRKSLTAFAHYVNAATIADMVAGATAVDFTAGGVKMNLALTTDLLGSIELQVTDMRYKNRLSMTNTIEVVLPFWLRGALRSDLAKRLGVENAAGITDAVVDSYFATRGTNVQWVYDWQDAFTGVSGGFGGSTIPVAWPATAKFLIYPQGTYVRALSDVIELSAVYDSTLLATNQFIALFMEQARLTLKRSFDARACTIPVTVSGATALGIDYTAGARQPTV